MGQFFTNIQVSGSAHALDRDELASRIVNGLKAEGFREASAPGTGLRRIYLSEASEEGWLTVLDSATEGQDPVRLDRMSEMISAAARNYVIGILVHDGDRLQMKLFRDGKTLAALDSWPGYFVGDAPSSDPGDLSEWARLLPPGRSVYELQAAWTGVHTGEGALPRLKRMARILGIDADRCALGANSLLEPNANEFVTLFFAGGPPIRDRVVDGLPAFGHTGSVEPQIRISENEWRRLTMISHSTGAPGSGLRVILWGSALQGGMVKIMRGSLSIGGPEDYGAIELNLDVQLTAGEIVLVANIEDISIPAGYASPADALADAGGEVVSGIAIWTSTKFNLDLDVVGIEPGEGPLHACLQPAANPDGQAIWTTDVRVESAT